MLIIKELNYRLQETKVNVLFTKHNAKKMRIKTDFYL